MIFNFMSFTVKGFSFTWFLFFQIKTTAQLDAALSFFGTIASEDLRLNEFEEACGVGMSNLTCLG